jgi:hypothetical protein
MHAPLWCDTTTNGIRIDHTCAGARAFVVEYVWSSAFAPIVIPRGRHVYAEPSIISVGDTEWGVRWGAGTYFNLCKCSAHKTAEWLLTLQSTQYVLEDQVQARLGNRLLWAADSKDCLRIHLCLHMQQHQAA